jgi:hypothetical protein
MDWQFILLLVLGIAALIATIAAIWLAVKLAKKKKPVWAYKTKKIIGLGSNAPPELKLTFEDKQVKDVYRTVFIFFNRGNEDIRERDVTERVAFQFAGAQILREPNVIARSKDAIKPVAKRVTRNGVDCVELDFLYLDHNDGMVVEVLHTVSNELACSANIIGTESIRFIGWFAPSRSKRSNISLALLFGMIILIIYSATSATHSKDVPSWFALYLFPLIAFWAVIGLVWADLLPLFSYKRFPIWARNIEV